MGRLLVESSVTWTILSPESYDCLSSQSVMLHHIFVLDDDVAADNDGF